jgi:ubiquinone/menaquinone biosynthesis C-methylase UbiE
MTDDAAAEAERVRQAYARRARLGLDSRYDYWTPANLFVYQSRERELIRLLARSGLLPLTGRRVLDVGCGDGGVLRDFVRLGASPADLSGVDLLPERIDRARELTPGARFEVADGQALPFADGEFDVVLGFTLLSSVASESARIRIATEMARVCSPGGAIIIYDFWVNPFNREVRPLRRAHVRGLFQGWQCVFASTTLAPPLVRALAPLPGGRIACSLLEVLPFLRTHFLAVMQRQRSPAAD